MHEMLLQRLAAVHDKASWALFDGVLRGARGGVRPCRAPKMLLMCFAEAYALEELQVERGEQSRSSKSSTFHFISLHFLGSVLRGLKI